MLGLAVLAACQAVTPAPAGGSAGNSSSTTPPAETRAPVPTAPRTPPALPPIFQSPHLNALDTPHTYLKDACEYLHDKWDSGKAEPGTIVLIVMLHSINQGKAEGSDAMNEGFFARMMNELHDQQFEAINTQQLADFLEGNAKIPARSVVLMQDGRRLLENFDAHFRPYWEKWAWPVVNAWDNRGATTEALWAQQASLEAEGWVDHQVYGPTMPAGAEHLTDQYLTDQLQQPLNDFGTRFEKAPIGIVWPNGVGVTPAQVARKLGYRLGFTFNPRGPIMFDWVPLADAADHLRPSYFPEGNIGDPLMTLPRYWPYQVHDVIDSVRITGKEAAVYARGNRATELEYYNVVCASEYGAIPG